MIEAFAWLCMIGVVLPLALFLWLVLLTAAYTWLQAWNDSKGLW